MIVSWRMSLESVAAEQAAWEQTCHPAITSDVIWKLDAYRASLFLIHVVRQDMRLAVKRHFDTELSGQLLHAAGSINANLAEGFSRSTRADRLRFLDYALGSDRECVSWYCTAADVMPVDTMNDRFILLARIRSLLLGLIRSLRRRDPRRRFEP
jgi:four helix bundle protein